MGWVFQPESHRHHPILRVPHPSAPHRGWGGVTHRPDHHHNIIGCFPHAHAPPPSPRAEPLNGAGGPGRARHSALPQTPHAQALPLCRRPEWSPQGETTDLPSSMVPLMSKPAETCHRPTFLRPRLQVVSLETEEARHAHP